MEAYRQNRKCINVIFFIINCFHLFLCTINLENSNMILFPILLLAACASSRMLNFSNYSWYVRSKNLLPQGPGPNYFDDSSDYVWVDSNSRLHLKIKKNVQGQWSCSAVFGKSLGYGSYIFNVDKGFYQIDPRAVVGFFTYLDDYHEIDVEMSQWGSPTSMNTQFVVQPYKLLGNIQRFDTADKNMNVIHAFTWTESDVLFQSFYANSISEVQQEIGRVSTSSRLINQWRYTGKYTPIASTQKIVLNLWLTEGKQPLYGMDQEIIINEFKHIPFKAG